MSRDDVLEILATKLLMAAKNQVEDPQNRYQLEDAVNKIIDDILCDYTDEP